MWKWLLGLGAGWLVYKAATAGPRPDHDWTGDLLLQGYAGDWHPMSAEMPAQPIFNAVLAVTNPAGIPVLWGLSMLSRGVSLSALPGAVLDVIPTLQQFGPPADTSVVGLLAYKSAVLDAIAKKHGGMSLAEVAAGAK